MNIGSLADELAQTANPLTAAATHVSVEHYTVPYEARRTLRTQMSNQALAELLPKVQGARIRIVGRPDDDPTNAASLARKRAINLRNYLVRKGVPLLNIAVEADDSPNMRQSDGGFASDVYVERESDSAALNISPAVIVPELAAASGAAIQEVPTSAMASEQSQQAATVAQESTDSPASVNKAGEAEPLTYSLAQATARQIAPLPSSTSEAEPDAAPTLPVPLLAPVPAPAPVPVPMAFVSPPVTVPAVLPIQEPQPLPAVSAAGKGSIGSDVVQKVPEAPPKVLAKPPFEILTGVPVDEQFRKFASKSDWTVIWAAPDFVVDRAVVLPPDFEAALTSFLQSANASGARLRATVYRGNRTVRVEEF